MISEMPEILGTPVAQCRCGACGHEFPIVWECRTSPPILHEMRQEGGGMSEPIRLMSVSPERIECIMKLKEENPDASHKTIAMLAFESEGTVGRVLKGTGNPRRKPMSTETRERRCCPECGSLCIERQSRKMRYVCTKCRTYFHVPSKCMTADVPYPRHKISVSE